MKKLKLLIIAVAANYTITSLCSISITPTSLELTEKSPIQELILENKGEETKLFEGSIKKWNQKDNKELFEETKDIIIIPISAAILPKKKQKFRVVLREKAQLAKQNTYRLFLSETQKRSRLNSTGISFLLNLSIPIFSNGLQMNETLVPSWSINRTTQKNSFELLLTNKGSKTFTISNMTATGIANLEDKGMHYLLPGAVFSWPLTITNNKLKEIKINYKIAGKLETAHLEVKELN